MNKIVVVGSSLAGVAAVESLRRQEFEGELVLIGEEFAPAYDRPPLSKQVLSGEYDFDRIRLRAESWSDDHDLTVRLGVRAESLDPARREVALSDGTSESFDGLVVATGAAALPLPGDVPAGVHTLRTYDDAIAIRDALTAGAKVVIVGGGFIGAEVAAAAIAHGCDVTVLEAMSAPLTRVLGPRMGSFLGDLHLQRGVDVRCGTPVVGYEGGSQVERVRLGDGSAVDADLVVVGIGARPSTGWLDGSGVQLANGVVCDAGCRTTIDGVVAAGDVAQFDHRRLGAVRIEHWDNAVQMAAVASTSLLRPDHDEHYAPVPYVWSNQYEHNIQVVGTPRGDDELTLVDGAFGDPRFFGLYSDGGRVTGGVGFNRAKMIRTVRAMLHDDVTVDDVVAKLSGRAVSA